MRHLARYAVFAFCGLLMASAVPHATAADPAKTITIAADIWCPINCAPDGPELGVGIDVAKKIFEPLGYTVNYVIEPWARAMDDVRSGKVDAVVGANETDDPSLKFPQHSISQITDTFYTRKDSLIEFKGMYSLIGKRVGVITDYGYNDKIKNFIEENRHIPGAIQEVGGEDALPQNIKKLLAGRVDIVIESRIVMDYALKRMKLEGEIKQIGSIPQGAVYVAFSPALPESKERARIYDQGYTKLKASGALREIYAHYGIATP